MKIKFALFSRNRDTWNYYFQSSWWIYDCSNNVNIEGYTNFQIEISEKKGCNLIILKIGAGNLNTIINTFCFLVLSCNFFPITLQDKRATVGENIIATTKMRNNFCYPLKWYFSNIAIAILGFSLLLPI